ncbi:ATP-binding cassette domain-containing protein [Lewinella sp. IMCC34191]|uniref:ABC transporter ATP-binding protein n=1 Tax=Lewinella sp. IMCC34191 TaxID=2259172 RepID=UPI0013006B05|nr:ATP-binding cassette domain-containing protein [Lewinella sp. IMCC34191]
MTVRLDEVSKRFGRQWIIKQLSTDFVSGRTYGISGRNGSGKSTLLRMLAGQLSPSRGRVSYTLNGRTVAPDKIYRYVSWTGPYFEIVEELTLLEMLTFHFELKSARAGLDAASILDRTGLTAYAQRPLLDCSSGMRQRILLATALYADTPLLLLDEPTVTLDATAAGWFAEELRQFSENRLVIIASNDPRDLASCEQVTDL